MAIVLVAVNAVISSSGKLGSSGTRPLYEHELFKKKMVLHGESGVSDPAWPAGLTRVVAMNDAQAKVEYERLVNEYRFRIGDGPSYDLVADYYGPLHTGRFLKAAQRIFEAYQAIAKVAGSNALNIDQVNHLASLSSPERDLPTIEVATSLDMDTTSPADADAVALDGDLINRLLIEGITHKLATSVARHVAEGNAFTAGEAVKMGIPKSLIDKLVGVVNGTVPV